MEIAKGLIVLLIAGFFQGSFVLPMTLTSNWKWENTWFMFSVLGMIVLNLLLAFIFIPHLFSVYQSVPFNDLSLLLLFGLGWGLGAVLFGMAMNTLGMALGYPVIMGLIAGFGAVIPMLVFHFSEILTVKGLALITGSIIVIIGIIICARAHVLKQASKEKKQAQTTASILMAVAAGILSCLPNIGFSFGKPLIDAALKAGASGFMAGNAVWALFFSMGFIPNALYTLYLLNRNRGFVRFRFSTIKNGLLCLLMAFMWIGSFYLYGVCSVKLGAWGPVLGWPLFISLSIIVGNMWGIAKSEWKNAPSAATRKLKQGMGVIFAAVILIGICNLL